MIKKVFFLSVFILWLFHAFYITQAHAHILKTDNDIGVVYHATPEDDPIINQNSNLYFDITDKSKRFKPEKCNCMLSITKGDETYLEVQLFGHNAQSEQTAHSINFAFKEKGIYQVTVSGTPIEGDLFQPFKITFNQRVERMSESGSNTEPNQSNTLLYLLPLLAGIIIVIVFAKKPKSKTGKSLHSFLLITLLACTITLLNCHLLLHTTHHKDHENKEITTLQTHLQCCMPQTQAQVSYVVILPESESTYPFTEEFKSQTTPIIRASTSRAPPVSNFS